jgi:hypothetical protein
VLSDFCGVWWADRFLLEIESQSLTSSMVYGLFWCLASMNWGVNMGFLWNFGGRPQSASVYFWCFAYI